MRFTHRFVTFTSMVFEPGFNAPVMSDAKRLLPEDTKRHAVDGHLRQVLHVAEVEPQLRPF